MHLVVVVSVPNPIEAAVAALEVRCELSAYEARTRLNGELPRIALVLAQRDLADERARSLEAAGFGVQVIAAVAIEHDEDRDMVQSIAFEPDAMVFTLRDGSTRAVAADAIDRIVQGVRVGSSQITREQTVKKFSATRAVLSGGLITRKTETQTETQSQETREVFAYVYPRGGATLALYERRVHYAFLGSARQASSFANYQTMVREIRTRAPAAQHDDRLMRPFGLGTVPLAPPKLDVATWKSDLAVALRALRVVT